MINKKLLSIVIGLEKIKVLETKEMEDKFISVRLNRYNPLSYPLLFMIFVSVIIYGAVTGLQKCINSDPFNFSRK